MECLKHSPPCGDLMGGYVVKEDTTGARQAPPIIMIYGRRWLQYLDN